MYVIKRIPDGAYVTPPGSEKSYTRSLQQARAFPTRAAAEAERCPENETVENVETEIVGR